MFLKTFSWKNRANWVQKGCTQGRRTELTSWSLEMTLSSASCECEPSAGCCVVASSESEMVDDGGCSKLAGMFKIKQLFTTHGCLRPNPPIFFTARVNSPTVGLHKLSVLNSHHQPLKKYAKRAKMSLETTTSRLLWSKLFTITQFQVLSLSM